MFPRLHTQGCSLAWPRALGDGLLVVGVLLLLGALAVAAVQVETAVEPSARPAVPLLEAGFDGSDRASGGGWGFTAAAGVAGGTGVRGETGLAAWAGARRWLSPGVIAGGVVSFRRIGELTDLALLARLELAAAPHAARLFPGFSIYAGGGPALFDRAGGRSAGLRLVAGLHLPSLWSSQFPGGPVHNLVWLLMPVLLLPTAFELQFDTGGGSVPPSIGGVLAIAL